MKIKVKNFLDNISVARKTAILIVVITAGVLFLGAFGHLGLYQLKNKFDNFFDKRFESVVVLDQLKDIYVLEESIAPSESEMLWSTYKQIEQSLNPIQQKIHKSFVYKIDTLVSEPQKNVLLLHENFSKLIQFHYKYAQSDMETVTKQYSLTIWLLVVTALFLVLFSTFFTYSIVNSTKRLIHSLSDVVKSKIDDYETLAHNYEDKVTKEVIRNREKDQIMYQHARLAAMGEMIGNIAHQWRQPLNALTILIQGFGTKSMTGKLDQAFIDKQVDEGLRLAEQMSNTIEDFRNFFSPHRDREYFSLEKSLTDTLELVEFFCKDEHIDIEVISKEDMRVFGYSNEFSQVILNLINNARDNFRHKNINDERKILIKIEKRVKPKQFAMISFIDNGGGIDPKIKDRIFEPYFTTKHKSTGTGIGLYMSKQIIEKQMQGLVTMKNIHSKMGGDKVYKCAQFIIAIPIK